MSTACASLTRARVVVGPARPPPLSSRYAEAYLAADASRELGLGRAELVALALLLGGDYAAGVRGVGIVNAMEVLRAFPVRADADDGADAAAAAPGEGAAAPGAPGVAVATGVERGLRAFRGWLDGDDELFASDANELAGRALSRGGQRVAAAAAGDELTPLARFHARHRNVRHVWACGDASFPSARVIEEYASPRVDESDARFSWAEPDLDGLRAFLAEARNARAESAARKKPRPLISPRAPADARSDSAGTKTRPTRP